MASVFPSGSFLVTECFCFECLVKSFRGNSDFEYRNRVCLKQWSRLVFWVSLRLVEILIL